MTKRDRLYEWVTKYRKPLIVYAIHDCGVPGDDAQDVVQEAFLRAWNAEISMFGEWAYLKAAVFSQAFNLKRNRARRGPHVVINEEVDPRQDEPVDAALVREQTTSDARRRVRNAIARLPEETRLVFDLKRRGFSYEEIRDELRIPYSTVRTRMEDAKKRLLRDVGELPPGIDWGAIADEDDHDQQG